MIFGVRLRNAITKILIKKNSSTAYFRCYNQSSLRVSLRELPHGLALFDSKVTDPLEVVIKEMQEDLVLSEIIKFVDAKPVHVVIDLDNLFALMGPVTLYFLPKSTALKLFIFSGFSAIRNTKIRLIDFEHLLGIDECSKHKTYRIHRQPPLLQCLTDPGRF